MNESLSCSKGSKVDCRAKVVVTGKDEMFTDWGTKPETHKFTLRAAGSSCNDL